jgi:hypothetical protein
VSMDRALRALALTAMTLAWLIPNHYPPWTSFYNESAMAIGLLALAAALACRRLRVKRSQPFGTHVTPRIALIVACAALVPWLQWSVGILHFSGDAVIASAYVFGAAAAISVGYGLSTNKSDLAALLSLAAVVASLLSSLIVISQVFGLAHWGLWAEVTTAEMRAGANLAQPNNFATLVGLGIVSTLYFYERGCLSGRLAVGLALLLLLAGALTQSRISLFFGILVVVAIHVVRRRAIPLRTQMGAVVILTFIHWALMAASPWLLSQLFGESPSSLAVRGVSSPRFRCGGCLSSRSAQCHGPATAGSRSVPRNSPSWIVIRPSRNSGCMGMTSSWSSSCGWAGRSACCSPPRSSSGS